MEHLLHYVWKHKLFPLTILQTTHGLQVEVIDPGLRNTDSGPDFLNAKLKIDHFLWVGNIEIHTHSSDWFRHGHDGDKAYDTVVLHVVEKADAEVVRSNGEPIPQMLLTCPESIKTHYQELALSDRYPACHSILSSLPKLTIHAWLSALQTERLEQKAQQINHRLELYNQHWEDTFFITLARNYGFGLNGDAFEAWAKLVPLRSVAKHRDDLQQVEAFFFGQAGLLEESFHRAGEEDTYLLSLRKEFRYLQHKFELTKVMDSSIWRFLRLRPDNFPTIRLAQLAYLYHQKDRLFSCILEAESLEEVRALLATQTSPYWETHFMFGRTSSQRKKTLGERSKDLMIINTVVPFLYTYGLHRADEEMRARAERFLEELKAEDNHIVRLWNEVGVSVDSAADSQALIQLQNAYCNNRKCLLCRFGYEYLRRK